MLFMSNTFASGILTLLVLRGWVEEMAEQVQPDWLVLLIGGASGSGKTAVAERIGVQFQVPWLQVAG